MDPIQKTIEISQCKRAGKLAEALGIATYLGFFLATVQILLNLVIIQKTNPQIELDIKMFFSLAAFPFAIAFLLGGGMMINSLRMFKQHDKLLTELLKYQATYSSSEACQLLHKRRRKARLRAAYRSGKSRNGLI